MEAMEAKAESSKHMGYEKINISGETVQMRQLRWKRNVQM